MHYSNECLNGSVKMKKMTVTCIILYYRVLTGFSSITLGSSVYIRYALFVHDLTWLTPFLPLCVPVCNWFAGRGDLFIMDFGPAVVPPNKTHFK